MTKNDERIEIRTPDGKTVSTDFKTLKKVGDRIKAENELFEAEKSEPMYKEDYSFDPDTRTHKYQIIDDQVAFLIKKVSDLEKPLSSIKKQIAEIKKDLKKKLRPYEPANPGDNARIQVGEMVAFITTKTVTKTEIPEEIKLKYTKEADKKSDYHYLNPWASVEAKDIEPESEGIESEDQEDL